MNPGKPRLGRTVQQLYRNWEQAKAGPGQVVVGVGLGIGVFSWDGGRIVANAPARNGTLAHHRPATLAELEAIDDAVRRDLFQVEARPVSGVTGGQGGRGTIAQASDFCRTVVLHSPTGCGLRDEGECAETRRHDE